MQKLLLLLFFTISTTIYAQSVSGKVYNQKTTAKNIEVINNSKKVKTITDEKGNFTIRASINDTISISSIFYQPQKILIKNIHVKNGLIIELKKIINEIDAVTITDINYSPDKSFENNKTTFHSQLKEDIKRNPYKYGPPPNPNFDAIAVIGLIAKLFKKKKNKSEIEYIEYEDLKKLFSDNRFFNEQLLFSDLKIPKEYKSLFFEFCSVQNINKTLISEKRDLELLDILLKYSNMFLELLQNPEKPKKD